MKNILTVKRTTQRFGATKKYFERGNVGRGNIFKERKFIGFKMIVLQKLLK